MTRQQFGQSRIIGTEDDRTARGGGEPLEFAANRFEVCVIIEMFLVDIENN